MLSMMKDRNLRLTQKHWIDPGPGYACMSSVYVFKNKSRYGSILISIQKGNKNEMESFLFVDSLCG